MNEYGRAGAGRNGGGNDSPRAQETRIEAYLPLSEVEGLRCFALFAPGFSAGKWALVEDLKSWGGPGPAVANGPQPRLDGASSRQATLEQDSFRQRARVVFAPYEQEVGKSLSFDGSLRQLSELILDVPPARISPRLDESGHAEGVREILREIQAGTLKQVNLTLRARFECSSGAALFSALCRKGIPPFAAWVRFPDGREIVSASPELFFRVEEGGAFSGEQRARRLIAEPMKGTAPPGAKEWLVASEKDRRELEVATELMVKELEGLCIPESVRVSNARRLLTLPYALQTVADVEGVLREELKVPEILKALHPPTSITGNPKNAAMALIDSLENEERGAYCGALGLWVLNEDDDGPAGTVRERATFSVLIRSAERIEGEVWRYGVGGGIGADSTPEGELAEARLKLGALNWQV